MTLLGFTLEQDASPAFASVVRDGVRLLLSGDGSSGKRPLPDGRRQAPGGWNRVHLEVTDLAAEVARLRAAGVSVRTNAYSALAVSTFAVTSLHVRDPGAVRRQLSQQLTERGHRRGRPRRGSATLGPDGAGTRQLRSAHITEMAAHVYGEASSGPTATSPWRILRPTLSGCVSISLNAAVWAGTAAKLAVTLS
jgi:hypothetical protein